MDFEMFRRETEQCDRVQDVLIAFSAHGGTGSGMGTLFLNRLVEDYPKSQPMRVAVVPSSNYKGSEVISPYNTILALDESLYSQSGMTLLANNDRIANLLEKR